MKRTTIMLPAPLKDRAERQAKSEHKSLGRYIRESLERCLSDEKPYRRSEDPLFTDFETFDDGLPGDVAEHHDKYLHQFAMEKYDRNAASSTDTRKHSH